MRSPVQIHFQLQITGHIIRNATLGSANFASGKVMVGLRGFEPPTSPTPRVRATSLRHSPILKIKNYQIIALKWQVSSSALYPLGWVMFRRLLASSQAPLLGPFLKLALQASKDLPKGARYQSAPQPDSKAKKLSDNYS